MHCKTEFVRNSKIRRKNDSKKNTSLPWSIWGTPVLIQENLRNPCPHSSIPQGNPAKPKVNLVPGIVGPPQCPAKPKDTEDLHPISKHIPHVSDFLLLWGGGRDDEPMLRYVKNSGTLSSLSTRALTHIYICDLYYKHIGYIYIHIGYILYSRGSFAFLHTWYFYIIFRFFSSPPHDALGMPPHLVPRSWDIMGSLKSLG
jgi:hypothetical protein